MTTITPTSYLLIVVVCSHTMLHCYNGSSGEDLGENVNVGKYGWIETAGQFPEGQLGHWGLLQKLIAQELFLISKAIR